MHQRIDVSDEDHKRRQGKKGKKRQFDIEEGQLDGAFQQKIFMGDGASRDCDIGENEEIREPEPAADRGCVLDGLFDLFEIVGLFGDFRKGSVLGTSGPGATGGVSMFPPGFLSSEPICVSGVGGRFHLERALLFRQGFGAAGPEIWAAVKSS
jgi:hypothetical protein